MEADRVITRFFIGLGAVMALLAGAASLALRAWWPLAALGLVLLGVGLLSLGEAAMIGPLVNLVMRAGERRGKDGPPGRGTPKNPDPAKHE